MIYAVNKRTKEHRIVEDHERYLVGEWHAVHADPAGWIEWHGGECPLPDGHLVDIRVRDGSMAFCVPANEIADAWPDASECFWVHEEHDGDIIAYRPAIEYSAKVSHPGTLAGPDEYRAQSEPPAWDVGGLPPEGCECEFDTNGEWKRCVVIAHIGGWAAFYYPDENIPSDGPNIYVNNKDFRPIRGEEDRAVEEMADVMREADGVVLTGRTQESIARALYRAGYRKTGGE